MIKKLYYAGSFLIVIFFITFAKIKASEAEKQNIIAQENLLQAERNLKEADRQREVAETTTIENAQLRQALEECNQ